MEPRKSYLDWLRVAAFGLLVPFHVGMLYASWSYPIKSPRLVPDLDYLLMLSTPWRLALIFLVAGVASRHLITKLGPGAFARDRLRRLLPAILFGMLVVNAPQTWIVAKAHGLTDVDFWTFWPSYVRADHSVLKPPGMAMPRWDHLWFLLYLLPYGLVFALLWKLKFRLPRLPLGLLLTLPALWLVLTGIVIERVWPRTDTVFNDWGAHLQWIGLFITGIALAPRADSWRWMLDHRRGLAMTASALGLCLLADHALYLRGALTPLDWLSYCVIGGLFGWAVILTMCGFAQRYLQQSSPALTYLNTAILPIYVLHQPILFAAAYALFPRRLPLVVESLALVIVTALGPLAIYHFAIRPYAPMRIAFGLRVKERAIPPDRVLANPAHALSLTPNSSHRTRPQRQAGAVASFRALSRAPAAAVGLLALASGVEDLVFIAGGKYVLHPELACTVMWDLWAASWFAAMAWSGRSAARPLARQEVAHLILPTAGFCLLAFGSIATHFRPLWMIPDSLGWCIAALCALSLIFTWWARIGLGSLWSLSVSRKENHKVMQDGAYHLVRHPIYTGLIIAAASHALLIGQPANLAGAVLVAVGFWLKARFEERFLTQELGRVTYAEYAGRTPMLVPFWPVWRTARQFAKDKLK
jgi:glucan biosynthesis protein C